MFAVGQELYLEIDLKKAKLAQLPIVVKHSNGEIADFGGPIEELKKNEIKINGMHYMRTTCRFYVR